jgi:hypothetical protein
MPARRLAGEPVDHVMAWVTVPDLAVLRSEQRYEDGFVMRYPRLAERVPSGARA